MSSESNTLGFNHHGLHPDKLKHHHAREKCEYVARGEGRHHFWKQAGQQRGEGPMSEAAQCLTLGQCGGDGLK